MCRRKCVSITRWLPSLPYWRFFSRDRPGLLHSIAKVLLDLGLSVALSKISTEGARATDVFYLRKLSGSKIKKDSELAQIVRAIKAALD